jgi:hypothetical protein
MRLHAAEQSSIQTCRGTRRVRESWTTSSKALELVVGADNADDYDYDNDDYG